MRVSFQSGRQCQSSFNADSLAASVLPLCAGSADLQGRAPACLPPSVLGNPSSLPLSDLTWYNRSCNSLVGCAAINGLQVLFFRVLVICEYTDYFLPLFGGQPVLRAQATQIRLLYHLDPHQAAEVAPDSTCRDISRICVAGQTFMDHPYQVENATSSLSDLSGHSQKPQFL